LNQLRKEKVEAIAGIARGLKFGTALQAFLEKVLESAEISTEALTRLLEQYTLEEGKKYDKVRDNITSMLSKWPIIHILSLQDSVNKQEMLSEREKLAIAAGLESMRVRLGHGFVTQDNLDRQVLTIILFEPLSRCHLTG